MLRKVGLQMVRGFCMGSADVVPGVSGGTIALVFGIYHTLVDQVRSGARMLGCTAKLDLAAARRHFAELEWTFLVPLFAGIGLAVLSLASFIEHSLEEEPVRTAAVFFGLVVGSIIVTARDLHRLTPLRSIVMGVVAVAAFTLLGLRAGPATDPAIVLVVGAGAVAICAMILPGISGSFILLMLGMYDYVLDAVNERDLIVAAAFAVGAVVGLGLFSQVLGWALERHGQLMLAGLVGLMAGSLRVLWPWPNGTGGTEFEAPADDVLVPIVFAVVAMVAVVFLALIARERDPAADATDV